MRQTSTEEKREAIITSIIAEKCKKLKDDYLNLVEDLQAFSPEALEQIKELIFGSSTPGEEILSLKIGNNVSIFTTIRKEDLTNCRFEDSFQAFFPRTYCRDYYIAFSKENNAALIFKIHGRILLEETTREYRKHLKEQLTAKKIENSYTANLGFVGVFDSEEDCFTEQASYMQLEKRLYSLLKEENTFHNTDKDAYVVEIGYKISKFPTEMKIPIVMVISKSSFIIADKLPNGSLTNYRNEKLFETDFVKEVLESFEAFKELEKIGNDAMVVDQAFTA